MATVSLKIRLNYNQILELTQQLSDDDKLELSRALAAETRGIKLRRLLETFKTDEISQKEIDAEVGLLGKRRLKSDCEMRIIIDTNLWISFLIGKKLSCLLELISNGNVELVVSKELLDEIESVASRPKFVKYFSKEHLDMLWDFLAQETLYYEIGNISSRYRDPKDDYLLELALVSRADYLITGIEIY